MRGRRCAKRSRGEWLRRHPLVRRLRVRPRQPDTRAASGPALGALRPLCEVHRRDTQARTGAEAKAERLLPRAAAERREARRRAIPPVISGDPEIGRSARKVTGCGVPHQRLSALCSPLFFGGAETDKARPARQGKRAAERWLSDNRIGNTRRGRLTRANSHLAAAIGPAAVAFIVDAFARVLRRSRWTCRHGPFRRHLNDCRRPERRGHAARKRNC